MKKISAILLGLTLAACAEDPARPSIDPAASAVSAGISGRYIIVFQDDVADVPAFVTAVARTSGVDSVRHVYQHAIKGFAGVMNSAVAKALSHHPQVKYIERDIDVPDETWTSTTRSGSVGWGLARIDERTSSDGFYSSYSDGTGVNIYIVDRGVDIDHPEFGGRAYAGYSSVSGYPAGEDCNGHGTAVASIAAGSNIGVASGATLYDVRTGDCSSTPSLGDRIAGVDWVVGNHDDPAVMNISFGLARSLDYWLPGSLGEAVESAIDAGIVTVVSAGNDSDDACDYSPKHLTGAIVVGATNSSDQRASFSNYGSCLDLFAPGNSVAAAVEGTTGTGSFSGTSFAAPYATGVAALVVQRNWGNYSVGLIEHVLRRSATLNEVSSAGTGSPNRMLYSHHTFVLVNGYGRVETPDYYTWTARPFGGNGSYTIRWDMSTDGGVTYSTVGYGTTYSRQVYEEDPSFTFNVVMTSGSDGHTEPFDVEVCMGGGSGFCGT